MESSTPLSFYQSSLSNLQSDSSCPDSGQVHFHGTNELIANLDHELWGVRLRALKCILDKIECSIVTTESLSRRIDLLNRLSDWLKTATTTETDSRISSSPSPGSRNSSFNSNASAASQGIPIIIRLLFLLAKHAAVRKFIIHENVDSLFAKLRFDLKGDTRTLLNALLDRVYTDNIDSFELQLEGPPEGWNDNASGQIGGIRKINSTDSTSSAKYFDRSEDIEYKKASGDSLRQSVIMDEIDDINISDNSAGNTYFPNQSLQTLQSIPSKNWGSGFRFGIPVVQLSAMDRRVLASTVESLLTKNETLVLTTTCFFRDVLLQDYPAEVFIQESALSMGLLEVAESIWNDSRIPYVATQGLLQLSHLLRFRMAQLNSSEFYETKLEIPFRSGYNASSSFSSHTRNSSSTNDTFVDTLCQLLKGLSRSILFHPQEFHLWRLLDGFSLTLCKCVYTFPVDFKSLSLGVQEVLLDLAYCYQKYYEDINSTALALCLSSMLKCLRLTDEVFILAYDARQCIRKLIRCPQLQNCWPQVQQYFLQNASPFLELTNENPDPTDYLPKVFEDLATNEPRNEFIPQEAIGKLLLAIQNATAHQAVTQAIESLWSYMLPLAINTRLRNSTMDFICKDVPWRDAFYRFLCVEPTCAEDEDLLIKVVDILSFILENLNEERLKLTEWIIPLCMEKGCAVFRLLSAHSLKAEAPYSGTVLPNVLRSLFDFYFTILKRSTDDISDEYMWNVFSTLSVIFHQLGDNGFPFPAVLQPILQGLGKLTCHNTIKIQLTKNEKYSLALIHRVIVAIISLQEHTSNNGISNESYRNQGVLYYASLSLYHLSSILTENENQLFEWIGKCCAVIPCLWESPDLRVKALGFQVCEILTRTSAGIIALMNILESPSTLWTSCYGALMDYEESAIVKQQASSTLYNLLCLWEEVERSQVYNGTLHLPNWSTLDDITKLMSHVYWLQSLSEVFRSGNDTTHHDESGDSSNTQLVTPKVLTTVCKILMKMNTTSLTNFHPEPFVQAVCFSGLCPVMFRLVGTHAISEELESSWWIDSCCAMSSLTEALICMCQLDRGISLMLIGDKHSLSSLAQLLALTPIAGKNQHQANEILSTLWVNIFSLLSILCADSGNNFEDLERCIWSQRNVVFSRLVEWLKQDALAKCRKIALTFTHVLLSKLMGKQYEKDAGGQSNQTRESGHPMLCREWKDKKATYGSTVCEHLVEVYEGSITLDDKQNVLRTLNALINLSPSAKSYAIDHDLIGVLLEKLKGFGLKYYDSADVMSVVKKTVNQWLEETISILSVLTSVLYRNTEAKKSALYNGIVDVCHKIFKWWKSYPDRTMLHGFIETLMNFTEEFPPGCQALTLTTSMLGIGPKKAPTPQSFLVEILEILQAELDAIESSCNLRSIELLFEFLKNAVFVIECRNSLAKSSILTFLCKLYPQETKKWGPKQHRVKMLYMDFLVSVSVHPDMQSAIAKVPEAIDVLVLLIDLGDSSSSLAALKILRNLSFQPANRTRFLCDDALMPSLSAKIRDSENLEEIESAAVGLWALISNSEKGKLSAKKSFCPSSVSKAVTRLRKMEHSSNDLSKEKQDLSNLINVLTTLSNILGSQVNPQTIHSSMSSVN